MLTLEDVTLRRFFFFPRGLNQIQWRPGSTDYSYVEQNSLISANLNGNNSVLVDLKSLNEKMNELNIRNLQRFPAYTWIDNDNIRFWYSNKLFKYKFNSKELYILNEIDSDAENHDIENTTNYIAFTKNNNLFAALGRGNIRQVTSDINENIINGQTVHRSEFGINKGTFWSPDGNYLAYYRMDQSMVADYPIVDINPTPALLTNIKYPMAGQTSHVVKVGIYNIKSEKTVWLKTGGSEDQYLTNVTWGPDEQFIYIAHLNRDQNFMRLIKYDVETGNPVKTLFEEKHDKYVEPEHGPVFLHNNKSEFLWFSERDGWDHLYLYNTEGKLLKQVTKGNWAVLSFHGFNEEGTKIYYTSTEESPVDRHYYSIDLKSGKKQKLTAGNGIHNIIKNSEGTLFIDNLSSLEVPLKTVIFDESGKILKTIHEAADPLKEYKKVEKKIFTITGENNLKFYCRLMLPPGLDKSKKYPVLVYVYGGPHAQLVTNTFYQDMWLQYMAQQGFIIFTIDNRGSGNRGLEFEQATFRKLGTKEIEDQMLGIKYLKSLDYVDPERIGVFGWSYGGFMSTSLITRKPEVFKAAVAGAPVTDWKYYEVMYTERYMDTPQTNPEGYEQSSTLNYVKNLEDDFLIVHGTSDNVVMWQNTLMFVQQAVRLNKPLEYFPYPGHGHGIGGQDRLHLYEKITKFFKEKL